MLLIWIEEDREEVVEDNSQGYLMGLGMWGEDQAGRLVVEVVVSMSLGVEDMTNTLVDMLSLRGLCNSPSRSCVCRDILD